MFQRALNLRLFINYSISNNLENIGFSFYRENFLCLENLFRKKDISFWGMSKASANFPRFLTQSLIIAKHLTINNYIIFSFQSEDIKLQGKKRVRPISITRKLHNHIFFRNNLRIACKVRFVTRHFCCATNANEINLDGYKNRSFFAN